MTTRIARFLRWLRNEPPAPYVAPPELPAIRIVVGVIDGRERGWC